MPLSKLPVDVHTEEGVRILCKVPFEGLHCLDNYTHL